MDTEEGNTSQVRRTSRARKINPKFFGDDAEYGSYKMLVDRITASKFSGNCKENENSNSDVSTTDPSNLKVSDTVVTPSQPVSSSSNTSGSINIALKTVSLKIPKKSKSVISSHGNLKIASGKVAPSVIVHCRSSTESEISEESIESEIEKRKPNSQEGNDLKKLKISLNDDEIETSLNPNIKVPPFVNCAQLFGKSYVPLPLVSTGNFDKNQPKIVVTSEPKLNFTGKKLKIVSLKPITTIKKDDISLDKSNSNSDSVGNKLLLGEGVPVGLKIVKKQIYPLSGSSLPQIVSKENKNEPHIVSSQKAEKMSEPLSSTKIFSSDGEDDIPLNSFVKQDVVKKKKKPAQKNVIKASAQKNMNATAQKNIMKAKMKNKKLTKVNDQDDLPLKAFIKKSKSISKGLSSKVKNTVSKKNMETFGLGTGEHFSQINEPPTKKKKTDFDPSQKPKSSLKLKISNIKSGASMKSQKVKSLALKKKKISTVNNGKTGKVKNGLGEGEKNKKLKKAKTKQLLSNESSSDTIKKKDSKSLHKLRFKFPKKVNKVATNDSPLSNETTNIVISVSGIEGDYACVAIDKDHISVPCNDNEDVKSNSSKSKKKLKSSSPKKYTVDSGLVLEEDVFSAAGTPRTSETKNETISKVEPTISDAHYFSADKYSVKKQSIFKKESSKNESPKSEKEASAKRELALTKKESFTPRESVSTKKEITSKKESFSGMKIPTIDKELTSVKRDSTFKDASENFVLENTEFSRKKDTTSLNLESAKSGVKLTSKVELVNKELTLNKLDYLCDNNLVSSGETLIDEIKPKTEEVETTDANSGSIVDSIESSQYTDKTKASLNKEESSFNKVQSGVNISDSVIESISNDTKSCLDIRDSNPNKMKTGLSKAKGVNYTEIKKHLVEKSDELKIQAAEKELNNVALSVKSERNCISENNENLGENKQNYQIKEQNSYRDSIKTAKLRSKEAVEKENFKEEKEGTHKLEIRKDREKDKKKEEKGKIDTKPDIPKKFDADHQKHKNHKSDNKREKEKSSSFLRSFNDNKVEEKNIKKEKLDSNELINKTHKDNKNKEKSEKSQKDLQGLKKLEKSYQSFNYVEKDSSKSISSPKQNKDTLKAIDKKETKIEREYLVKDVNSPVIKPKKRENFEEALLNIPLPKLAKSKKDKDEKGKRTSLKDKKYDAKESRQEIHLLKHKEAEISKGFHVKMDKTLVKSELSSKEVASEEKRCRKEERKHSSNNDKADRKNREYDSKDNIKMYGTTHDNNDKSKSDERDRSRHSHKKHKREHSDSHHKSHYSSSERKKHRSDEKYDKKHNKDKVIKEDNKDILIKKIVDGKEDSFADIKIELNATVDHSVEKNSEELLNSNLPGASHTKMELKTEIIVEEEHLVNTKCNLKEELKDAETCNSEDNSSTSNVSDIHLKKEPSSTDLNRKETLIMLEENIQQERKQDICEEVLSSDINKQQNNEIKNSENINSTLIGSTQIENNKFGEDVTESDLGILDELRNLKRTFEKPQDGKTLETDVNNITSAETEVNMVIPETPISEIKLENHLCTQSSCKIIDKSTNTKPTTTKMVKSEIFDKASLDSSDMMASLITVHSKSETEIQKNIQSQELVNLDNFSHMDSKSSKLDYVLEEQDNRESDNLKSSMISTDISDITEDQSMSSCKDLQLEDLPQYCNIPVSSIPLPNESIKEPTSEAVEFETSFQEMDLHSSKGISMCLSESDEGFISEVSTNTRDFSSDGETILTSDLSDDDSLSTTTIPSATPEVPKELTPEEKEEMERRNKEIVQERMKSFELLTENLYLSEKVKNKRSKEVRRMVCDCTLTKEEIANNEMGCGDDCLNRLLMIECGTRCPLKDHCMNKKFQQKDYSKLEVFNAVEKGCGVRSCEDIKPGTFIMEYIGEVFDTKEFKRRRKEYAKDGSPHFYFMALRPDRLIDATRKGGISRFINHSCSPNAETQKWTVNGDIRIGFFATKFIPCGEEISFDYRLERYGREPQKCYCGTPECRGWLGEPPDKKTKEEKEEDRRRELKDKQKREAKRFLFEDMDLEDEIEKLTIRGLRNRQDTLDLSRLMVRCEDSSSRLTLLKILESGEEASKRLFLDYHGLKLLWSWMVDISSSHKCILLKLEILKTLKSLPITNKTEVSDSRVISIVERWSKIDTNIHTKELQGESTTKKLSDGSDSDTEIGDIKEPSPDETPSPPDDSSQDSNEVTEVSTVLNKIEGEDREESSTIDVQDESKSSEAEVTELAKQLLSVWSELKEAFKIPKKKRIEMMKEHEKEVDDEYAKYLDKKSDSAEDRTYSYYESWRHTSTDRDKPKEYRDRFDRDRRRERRWSKWRDSFDEEDKGLSKEERRERFAKQVAREEEEARQRKLQEEMWNLHLERCSLLGHDPYYTPIFDPSGQYYWDPDAGNWQAYIGPSGNLPVPASYGMNHSEVGAENIFPNIPSHKMFGSGSFYPLPHAPNLEGEQHPLGMTRDDQSSSVLDLASIPLPGEAPLTPNETPVLAIPLPGEENSESLNGIETPPMAPPGPVTIKLPSKWKIARDIDRRIYFYHTKTRHTQWELPTKDLHEKLMKCYSLTSDSESDIESDSDSTSSSDSEDFSSDEDDNDEDEPESDPVKKIENELNEKMIRRPKGKKVRSEKLVQERVISPILFEDREAARRERKEAKERARVEARKERYGMLKKNMSEENTRSVVKIGASKSDVDTEENLDLSEENTVSPNDNDEDDHLEEQLLKFSRKQKSEPKSHFKAKSKERAATALADSSDRARKIKDNFRSRMATYIVSVLNPFRKADCKEGRITSNEDFKYLARKLTHFVMVKELKQLPSVDGLECSDSVKHKTKEFVRKYMSKYGDVFKRDPNDTKEY